METNSAKSSACTCTADSRSYIRQGRSHSSSYLTNQPPTVPETTSCSLTHLITHPLTKSLALLVAFGLLVYGLYLLTPNLRRPKQKPLRSTPLVEYNLAFDRLVEDLRLVVELGGHEEVVREVSFVPPISSSILSLLVLDLNGICTNILHSMRGVGRLRTQEKKALGLRSTSGRFWKGSEARVLLDKVEMGTVLGSWNSRCERMKT